MPVSTTGSQENINCKERYLYRQENGYLVREEEAFPRDGCGLQEEILQDEEVRNFGRYFHMAGRL